MLWIFSSKLQSTVHKKESTLTMCLVITTLKIFVLQRKEKQFGRNLFDF